MCVCVERDALTFGLLGVCCLRVWGIGMGDGDVGRVVPLAWILDGVGVTEC